MSRYDHEGFEDSPEGEELLQRWTTTRNRKRRRVWVVGKIVDGKLVVLARVHWMRT